MQLRGTGRLLVAAVATGVVAALATCPGVPAHASSSTVHAMAKSNHVPAAAAHGPHLTYRGGHVLSNVKIDFVVYDHWGYGADVPQTGGRSVQSFLTDAVTSRYVNWLSEYNTPTQGIGLGSFEGIYTIPAAAGSTPTNVSDAQINADVASSIAAGKLPPASANRLYVIYFPPGLEITTPFGNSVDDFCAYHDTVKTAAHNAYIAVMADQQHLSGCGLGTAFDNLTMVTSHEVVEAITDPGVGLNSLAWYDGARGEIGDICNQQTAAIALHGTTYAVQKEWSNQLNRCIAAKS